MSNADRTERTIASCTTMGKASPSASVWSRFVGRDC
jgi:hypothetical protein